MQADSFSTPHEYLRAECTWALACLNSDREGTGAELVSMIRQEVEARLKVSEASEHIPALLLRSRVRLTAGAYRALALLACCELDRSLSALVRGHGTRDCPDMSVRDWRRLLGDVRPGDVDDLLQHGLIEIDSGPHRPQYRRAVRCTDRALELFEGELRLPSDLAAVSSLQLPDELDARRRNQAGNADMGRAFLVCAGPAGTDRTREIRGRVAARTVLIVRSEELRGLGTELERTLRAISREALLFDAVPLFEDVEQLLGVDESAARVFERSIAELEGPVLATMGEHSGVHLRSRPVVLVRAARPSIATRTEDWRRALEGSDADMAAEAAARFAIGGSAIVNAAAAARVLASPERVTAAHIHAAVRAQADQALSNVASRIETTQTWDDLVLPLEQFDQVVELVARVRHKQRVLGEWGFGDKIGKSHGVCALLSGPPGTGKTMAAGLIAKELGLDLYQVDLSKIMSKYIGETEKQLAAVFDAAELGHAVILFDEADSIFGKRTQVRSSNDRYANLEVNFLLQRMESFSGISLLTTNHEWVRIFRDGGNLIDSARLVSGTLSGSHASG